MKNAYEDHRRAAAYARLEFAGTYYLAYRDLPQMIARHARGKRAIDFGCGTGRSTRFLKQLGFEVTGIDISAEMLAIARERDPDGEYLLTTAGDFVALPCGEADLILAAFPFDNIPTLEEKERIARGLGLLLAPEGRFVNLVSTPAIYVNEWVSFSTKDYPENRRAKSGDLVRIVVTDTDDPRPVEDVVCSEEDYRSLFERAGLRVLEVCHPLGRAEDPVQWVNEREVAPWAIYVLGPAI